eukprot:3567469-Amphidinium_carterae.1
MHAVQIAVLESWHLLEEFAMHRTGQAQICIEVVGLEFTNIVWPSRACNCKGCIRSQPLQPASGSLHEQGLAIVFDGQLVWIWSHLWLGTCKCSGSYYMPLRPVVMLEFVAWRYLAIFSTRSFGAVCFCSCAASRQGDLAVDVFQ